MDRLTSYLILVIGGIVGTRIYYWFKGKKTYKEVREEIYKKTVDMGVK